MTEPHLLELKFNDGTEKIVDVRPVFEPLQNAEFFARMHLDEVCGTVTWPNGADLAPEALYELADINADART